MARFIVIALIAMLSAGAQEKAKVQIVAVRTNGQWFSADGKPLKEAPPSVTSPAAVHGWIGVALMSLSDTKAKPKEFTSKRGALINAVLPNSPAVGKLKKGDVITAANDKPVKQMIDVLNATRDSAPGSQLTLTVFRNAKSEPITLTIGAAPDPIGMYVYSRAKDANIYEIHLDITPWKADDAVTCLVSPPILAAGKVTASSTKNVGQCVIFCAVPFADDHIDLDVGVADGSWKTIGQTNKPGQVIEGKNVKFSAARRVNGVTGILVPSTRPVQFEGPRAQVLIGSRPFDEEMRELMGVKFSTLLNVTRSIAANERPEDTRASALVGGEENVARKGSITDASGQEMSTFVFPNIDPGDIDSIVFQTRPYEWIRFEKIATKTATASQ